MEKIKLNKILREAYASKKSLTKLAKELKMGRNTLSKRAGEIGLDFSNLKLSGSEIDKTLLAGRKIGKLTVQSYDSRDENGSIWLCNCDCGNTIKLPAGRLFKGKGSAKSCGCEKHKNKKGIKSPYWRGFEDLSSTKWSQIKRNAKKRGIIFNLEIEDAYDVYLKQNKKCRLTGLDIIFSSNDDSDNLASLDRINSSLPYEKGNIQWVCKKINYMKHCLTQENFIYLCNLVVKQTKNDK